jgi:hypothetical protein
MKLIAAIILLIGTAALAATAQNTSVYTDLTDKKCKTLESNPDEGGSYLGECPGVAGYKLQVLEGDLRQSINVIDPKRKKTELDLWNVSGGFSSVGEQAEWRMKGKTPIALIVRFNVSENPEDSSKITSYLVVMKITKEKICVTEVLKPTRSHNFEARRAADRSAARPCRFQE